MDTQRKETALPRVRCSKHIKHMAYKIAQKRGISYAELIRHLIQKEDERTEDS